MGQFVIIMQDKLRCVGTVREARQFEGLAGQYEKIWWDNMRKRGRTILEIAFFRFFVNVSVEGQSFGII